MAIENVALLAIVAVLGLLFVLQHRRARWMARFVAPQVADLVRERGLRYASKSRTREISAVYWPQVRGAMVPAETFERVRALLAEYRSRGK